MKKVLIFSILALISTPAFGFDYDTIIGPNIPPNPYQTAKPVQKCDMGPYIRNMQRKVRENWKPSAEDRMKKVVLSFTLQQDGGIDDIHNLQVLKSSGSRAADQTAMFAVAMSLPFGQLPQCCKDELKIQFVFDNNVLGVSYR